MQIVSDPYSKQMTVGHETEQAAKANGTARDSGGGQTSVSSSNKDSVEISGTAAKLSQAEARERAALARIEMLNRQNAALTGTDAKAEGGDAADDEDPVEKFRRVMFEMMQNRLEIWEENAAEQSERQKEEMAAAMQELEDARAEKKAAQEAADAAPDAATETATSATTDKMADGDAENRDASHNAASSTGRNEGQDTVIAGYGKKGSPVRSTAAKTGVKSSHTAVV